MALQLPASFVNVEVALPLLRALEEGQPPLPNLPLLEAMPHRGQIAQVCSRSAVPTPACFAVRNRAPYAAGWDWDSAKYSRHADDLLKSEYLHTLMSTPPGLDSNLSAKRFGRMRKVPLPQLDVVVPPDFLAVGDILGLQLLREASQVAGDGLFYVRVHECTFDGRWTCVPAPMTNVPQAPDFKLEITRTNPLKLGAPDFGPSADRVRISHVWKNERDFSIISMKAHRPARTAGVNTSVQQLLRDAEILGEEPVLASPAPAPALAAVLPPYTAALAVAPPPADLSANAEQQQTIQALLAEQARLLAALEEQRARNAEQQQTIQTQRETILALQRGRRERSPSDDDDADEMQQLRTRARVEDVLADAPATARASAVWASGGPSHQPPTVQGGRMSVSPAKSLGRDADWLLAPGPLTRAAGSGDYQGARPAASVADVTHMMSSMSSTFLNAKNQLQEFCMDQRRAWPLPVYVEGLPHATGHSCTVQVYNLDGAIVVEAVGAGTTKKAAQMKAAESAFEQVCEKYLVPPRRP